MAPNTFWNIRDGQRDRLDVFAEWEARWSPQWLTQIGLRAGQVRMDSGAVQGYNSGYAWRPTPSTPATASAHDTTWTSPRWRYTPTPRQLRVRLCAQDALAQPVRALHLVTGGMAMRMINLVGDGNGYVGNPDLARGGQHPERTADWHDTTGERWGVKLTPYLTLRERLHRRRTLRRPGAMSACTAANNGATQGFVYLRFANQDVRLHGLDLSGLAGWATAPPGAASRCTACWAIVRGKDRRTGDRLHASCR
jgi:iron complex outermembrane receptor protein